jgi:hypothetical protein
MILQQPYSTQVIMWVTNDVCFVLPRSQFTEIVIHETQFLSLATITVTETNFLVTLVHPRIHSRKP